MWVTGTGAQPRVRLKAVLGEDAGGVAPPATGVRGVTPETF